MAFFKEHTDELPKPIKILDVGGNEEFWENAGLNGNEDIHITILNLEQIEVHHSNLHSVKGDATNLSEYGDEEFDIAFSNSVIEHLYNQENQKKMADEMVRVSKKHYVQTPNKYFIIEPHYLLPYFQFLPKGLRYFILTKTRLSRFQKWDEAWARQYIDEIMLLSKKDMRNMFPSSKIWNEKFMGMNKSFVAHNFD